MKIFLSIIILFTITYSGLSANGRRLGFDQFRFTPLYEIAQAAEKNDPKKINEILKSKKPDLDFKSEFGYTILMIAVYHNKYKAVEALLKNGANPNIRDNLYRPALGFIKDDFHENKCFIRLTNLLIQNGADVNAKSHIKWREDSETQISFITTPLIDACISACMEKIKLLITHGADPNVWLETEYYSPLSASFFQERMDVVKYLLTEVKVKIPPYTGISDKDTISLLGQLRRSFFEIGSKNHKLKMEIVKFLKDEYKLDYFKEPVSPFVLAQIKKNYPENWEEYLQKY